MLGVNTCCFSFRLQRFSQIVPRWLVAVGLAGAGGFALRLARACLDDARTCAATAERALPTRYHVICDYDYIIVITTRIINSVDSSPGWEK